MTDEIREQIELLRKEQQAYAETVMAMMVAYMLPDVEDPAALAKKLISNAKVSAT